jgi:hypothetical protein
MSLRPSDGPRLEQARLHSGPDLGNAYERSVKPAAATGSLLASCGSLYDSLTGVLNAPSIREPVTQAMITGTEQSSRTTMRILFRGQGRSLSFCARHILGTNDFETAPFTPGAHIDRDLSIADCPRVERDFFARRPALNVPHWLRQRAALGADWKETLARISTPLRKRLARMLGQHAYTARIECGPAAARAFYERLYLPFVTERFGPDAIVPDERSFLRQAESSGILQLRIADEIVAAVLVKQRGETFYIGKSAVSVEHDTPYRSDLLDYFCFLLAQLCGCRWLDFGSSRPHVEDGVFLNKAKWRPELVPAGSVRTSLRIRPTRSSPAALAFLRRNGFIERRQGAFVVRRLAPEVAAGAAEVERANASAVRVGLHALVMVTPGGADPVQAFLSSP